MPPDTQEMPQESLELLPPIRLGSVPRNSTLIFHVPPPHGFVADARLELENRLVAAWDSEEISGTGTPQILQPVGLYTLQIVVAYTSPDAAPVTLTFKVIAPNSSNAVSTEQLSFEGKAPGLHRAIAFVRVVP